MTTVISRVHPVHLMNADWAPGAVTPQTKPIDLGRESAENWLLPSTCASIYHLLQLPILHIALVTFEFIGAIEISLSIYLSICSPHSAHSIHAASYSYRRCVFRGLCLSVTVGHAVERCKTAKPTEMPFGIGSIARFARAQGTMGCTLAPLGEYDWTIHARWQVTLTFLWNC